MRVSLSHPVEPDPAGAAIHVVIADRAIDGRVDLYAGHLGAGEQAPHVNLVDRVIGDSTEDCAQAADNARLLAVGDVVPANDMMTDGLLVPSIGRSRWIVFT